VGCVQGTGGDGDVTGMGCVQGTVGDCDVRGVSRAKQTSSVLEAVRVLLCVSGTVRRVERSGEGERM
jgi:hypothetical protein